MGYAFTYIKRRGTDTHTHIHTHIHQAKGHRYMHTHTHTHIHTHTYTHTHTHTHRQRGTDTGQRKSINGSSRGCTYTAAKTSSPLPKSSLPGPMFRCYQKRQCGMSKEPYSVAKEAYVVSSCKANAEMAKTRVQVSLLTWGRWLVISKVACVVCKRVQHTTAHTTADCNTLQHTATQCNTLQPPSQKRPVSCAKECNTLQHTATHRNHTETVHMNKAHDVW